MGDHSDLARCACGLPSRQIRDSPTSSPRGPSHYDVAFATRNRDVFASVGADGSVRLFDLRSLEHSTIIYESRELMPLLRLSWNRQDPNYPAVRIQSRWLRLSTVCRSPLIRVPAPPQTIRRGRSKSAAFTSRTVEKPLRRK